MRRANALIQEQRRSPDWGHLPTHGDPLAAWLGEWLAEPSQADNLFKLAASEAMPLSQS